MTKDDLKKYLLEQGASETLVKMPAVMERIYSYFEIDIQSPFILYCGKTNKQMTLGTLTPNGIKRMLSIGKDGSIIIKNNSETRSFEERPNGEAVYINNDSISETSDPVGEYLIDRYGMDISYNDGETEDIKRNDNGTITIGGREYRDDGSPILNIEFYFLRQRNGRYTWDKYKDYLTANYPITSEWFEKKENEKLQNTTEQNTVESNRGKGKSQAEVESIRSENEQLREERDKLKAGLDQQRENYRALREENKELEDENEELKRSQQRLSRENEQNKALVETSNQKIQALQVESEKKSILIRRLQEMLKQTLEICKKVSKNWLLRTLAGIKKNTIPEGLPEASLTEPEDNNSKIIQPEEMGQQQSVIEPTMQEQQPETIGAQMPEPPSPTMEAQMSEPPSPTMEAQMPEPPSPMMGAQMPEPPSPMMGAQMPEPPSPTMEAQMPEPPSPMIGAQMPNQQPQQWQQEQMQGQQSPMMGAQMPNQQPQLWQQEQMQGQQSPMMGAQMPESPSPMMGAQMPNQQPQQWQQGQMQGQQPSMMGTTMSGPQIPEQ